MSTQYNVRLQNRELESAIKYVRVRLLDLVSVYRIYVIGHSKYALNYCFRAKYGA